jgi:DNA-binding transcriptional ArsR family regulator
MPETAIGNVMHALADPTRRRLFERIVDAKEITVGELARDSTVSQPAISQHLRSLKEAGLVTERREGRKSHYRAEAQGLAPLIDWLGHYGLFWRERFVALRTLLKEIDV